MTFIDTNAQPQTPPNRSFNMVAKDALKGAAIGVGVAAAAVLGASVVETGSLIKGVTLAAQTLTSDHYVGLGLMGMTGVLGAVMRTSMAESISNPTKSGFTALMTGALAAMWGITFVQEELKKPYTVKLDETAYTAQVCNAAGIPEGQSAKVVISPDARYPEIVVCNPDKTVSLDRSQIANGLTGANGQPARYLYKK